MNLEGYMPEGEQMTNEEREKLIEAKTIELPITYAETHVRQLDLIPETALEKTINVVGLGGIGSPTAYLLAKMGFKEITIFDFDDVELHNISTQMYGLEDVSKQKNIALFDKIYKELGVEVGSHGLKMEEIPYGDITILALDNMDERIKLWNNTHEYPQHLIDARMGLEFSRIYTFSPYRQADVAKYEKQLYPSSESEALPCTARAVGYNTFFIASIIASIVKKLVMGEPVPFEIMGDIGELGIAKFK